eukprot:CAMPEP_0174720542 /NCGR_PEP_ID=MMETSP1094-20130205/33787_1 /TAXON_ID=156173 /ORGANISM="Chrysochromulina brevifilum, Strain UTEX LB 985" /LENGTH=97 /DNA_ID=CAMNT_0015921039 /DNA_START=274 /DNA_END=563 /DNA_ORIENTATION=-
MVSWKRLPTPGQASLTTAILARIHLNATRSAEDKAKPSDALDESRERLLPLEASAVYFQMLKLIDPQPLLEIDTAQVEREPRGSMEADVTVSTSDIG